MAQHTLGNTDLSKRWLSAVETKTAFLCSLRYRTLHLEKYILLKRDVKNKDT